MPGDQKEKRTIAWNYEPPQEILQYLRDMRDAIGYALQVAYRDAVRDDGKIPSPIQLRREIREWFYPRYDYARHHINPVCRASIAMLRSYRKNDGELRIPQVKKLAVRIDAELFKIFDNKIRVTLQPNHYVWIQINTANKRYEEYSRGKPSELLITDGKVCLTFIISDGKKPLGSKLIASDLNFSTIDSTKARVENGTVKLESINTEPIKKIAQIQNDFSRRRRMLQMRIRNPDKRIKKLRKTRGRQRNRIRDALHKLSTRMVRENQSASFVFEKLTGIRSDGSSRSKKLRTYLNRWPYRLYQSMVEYKSPNQTLYVNPGGTSSRCPVCGGRLEHPAWAMNRCETCGADYGRNRLSSLAILCRGMRLCGQPFAVSADASWRLMRDEYLYAHSLPEAVGAGWTETANAPNLNMYAKIHV